jgi:hypothetical protein
MLAQEVKGKLKFVKSRQYNFVKQWLCSQTMLAYTVSYVQVLNNGNGGDIGFLHAPNQ